MSLTLVLGLANAGKTGIVLGEMTAAAARGESPTLVVPTLADVRRIESELAHRAPLGVRTTTLGALKLEIWQLAGDGRRTVGSTARQALMRSVLAESTPEALQGAARTPGFVRFLARFAQEAGAVTSDAATGQSSATKRAVWDVVRRYEAALAERGLVEAMWLGGLIAELDVELPGSLGIARFDTLSAADARLIGAFSRRNRVIAAVTWADGAAQTRANDRVVDDLLRCAGEVRVVPERPATSELEKLAQSLYERPSGLQATGAVIPVATAGVEAEAAMVARIVADEVCSGREPGRIAVAFPGFSERSAALHQALAAEGIAASLDYPRDLGATAFGRAFLTIAALGLDRGGRAEASAFAASPYSGMTPARAHEADRRWRRGRISEPRALLGWLAERGVTAAKIARAASGGGAPHALRNWKEVAERLFTTVWDATEPLEAGHDLLDDARAYRSLLRALEELQSERAYLDAPADALDVLSGVTVREGNEDALDAVQVCEARDIGARRFDVVVLGGLTAREWPLESVSPAMEAMRGAGEDTSTATADGRRLAFYSLVTRARERLYLVRQSADSDGRALRPSVLFEEVVDAYRSPSDAYDSQSPLLEHQLTMARSEIERLAPALTYDRRARRLEAAGMSFAKPLRDRVADEEALEALSVLDDFSATEVEAYLECPYKWFHSRIVRPEEIDSELGARELGTEAHRLLAAFYRGLPAKAGLDRVTPETLERALAVMDVMREEDIGKSPRPAGLAEEMAVARARAWARNVIAQDAHLLAGFAPVGIEQHFGADDRPLEFAGARFRGVIDRIDAGSPGVFVTDYKSSRVVPGMASFETAGKVQAVIYARAAEELYDAQACGSVYRSMRSGILRGFWRSDLLGTPPGGMCDDDALDSEGFAQLVSATEERVAQAIAGMREGRIPRRPAVSGACTYCAIAGVCEGARR